MRQAIVIASFGAMGDDSRERCLDALEADFRAEFPEAVIVQAFTSTFIRTSLEKRGLHVDSLEEALLRLSEEDVTHVLVQPTYMTPGEEYEKKVLDVVPAYTSRYEKLTVGEPAFFEEADYTRNLIALCRSISCRAMRSSCSSDTAPRIATIPSTSGCRLRSTRSNCPSTSACSSRRTRLTSRWCSSACRRDRCAKSCSHRSY